MPLIRPPGTEQAGRPAVRRRRRSEVVDPSALLARLFPHSYRARLVVAIMVLTLTPMLVLSAWLLTRAGLGQTGVLVALLITLGASVLGFVVSLHVVRQLLQPVRRAVAALDSFEQHRVLPEWTLDAAANDETGRLLRGVHRCLSNVDATQRQLERHALEDPLTHAMNRRGCLRALEASVAQTEASGDPFVLCVIDLDNLKHINDRLGHSAGDYALIALVDSARQCCLGTHDWIGRWGGDEFLLGMHADPAIAMDRIRLWMNVLARPSDGSTAIHASAGVAYWEPGLESAELYRRADASMYRAKFGGGQRAVRYETVTDDVPIAEIGSGA